MELGQAKVPQLDLSLRVIEYVSRLQVPVDDALTHESAQRQRTSLHIFQVGGKALGPFVQREFCVILSCLLNIMFSLHKL